MSKAEAVEAHIRSLISSGQLEPGQFIDKTMICTALGVSRQPVTTALTALAREGLVDIRPQLGSYVAKEPPQTDHAAERRLLGAIVGASRGIGFQAGVDETGLAGMFVSCLAARPDLIPAFLEKGGSELLVDGEIDHRRGCLNWLAQNGKIVGPEDLAAEAGALS